MKNNILKSQKGFSLIELSIVLIVIGLLVVGIVAGNSLIKAAELRAIAREFEEHKTAIATFRATYDYLPGDVSEIALSEALGVASSTPALHHGDGDGRIEYVPDTQAFNSETEVRREGLHAWVHLYNAGMTNFASQYEFGPWIAARPGITVPESKRKGGGYSINYGALGTGNGQTNYLLLGGSNGVGNMSDGPLLTTMEARIIDKKYDDGMPRTGDIWGANGIFKGNISTCINSTTGDFDLTVKDAQCSLSYKIFQS